MDKNAPSFCGVGYLGYGPHRTRSNGKYDKAFTIWQAMIQRCYRAKTQQDTCPSYNGCSVVSEWHNFQNFAKWYYKNSQGSLDLHLDKDLTVIGNKQYGPNTCSLVPRAVNSLLISRRADRGPYPIGVQMHKSTGKFRAMISVDSKLKCLGLHKTEYEAFVAYKIAKEQYVRDVALKYKDHLTATVYNNLLNFTVNIDD